MIKDKYSTRITIDGRLFQIDFWTDTSMGTTLPYYAVEEVVTKWRKRFFLFGDYIEYETHIPICRYWIVGSRVEAAKADIRTYLEDEKKGRDELYEVSRFCRTQATASNERNVNGQ